ncbi:hypothetical protein [Falsiroseomonas sp. E2-1-a20]|uniref:hypothetical protein n=1 Tax=Falsiroseomonas sp. E2-1-a20 TaxID=3239300 RepID=UPI003F3B25E7
MSIARKAEQRILAQGEREVVDRTHHPAIAKLSREDLAETRHLLRTFRDKARDVAQQQRREMRGKGEARGVAAARDNTGTVTKQQVFGQALKRVNCQIGRMEAGSSPSRGAADGVGTST